MITAVYDRKSPRHKWRLVSATASYEDAVRLAEVDWEAVQRTWPEGQVTIATTEGYPPESLPAGKAGTKPWRGK